MASLNAAYTNAGGSTFEERAERQQATYWRARANDALNRLEAEARRMFMLEVELGQFAQAYYEAVGDVAERLAQVEQQLALEIEEPVVTTHSPAEHMAAMPAVLASRDAYAERRAEVKARYRTLAKEIHPDRAMVVEGAGAKANAMQTLNTAYQQGDLAALLRLEAEMYIERIRQENPGSTLPLEHALREVEQATNTYADGYRNLLNSPLNELMLRAMSARLAGWDWMDAVVRKVERAIEEKQRAAVMANIAKIGAWREGAQPAA